ncbi:GAF and ANTAR domain-containing protein [Actinoplanes sp. NPDC048967]|uniref:GAF and ANTAR domain-containing protein n=1 Tax=Actinoplanes sp. NPDC048967 TaxID=3155269 RepID=UPI0033C5F671
MTFVFTDPHGTIGRMAAPQRSSGRNVSRRVPGSGMAASPDQVRGAGRRRPPPTVQTILAAPDATPAALTSAAAGPLMAGAGGEQSPVTAITVPEVRLDLLPPAGRPASGVTGRPSGPRPVEYAELPSGPHPVELAGLLHELTARLLGADDVPQALDRLAAFAAGAITGTVRCSVALIGEGGPPVVAAFGTAAKALDDLEYAGGDGPGLEAARTRALVTAPDLQSDPRWPRLAECARAEGVHSVVAIPLDVQRSSVGALSLFVATPGGLDPELLLTAMAIVNQAELLLGELGRREGLREGATVDRAAGVIIAQRGCGVQEAYTVLRETAQRLGLDRRAVAERLIAAAARNAEA